MNQSSLLVKVFVNNRTLATLTYLSALCFNLGVIISCMWDALVFTVHNSSCWKIMFSQASVILFKAGVCIPACTRADTRPPGQKSPLGRHPQTDIPSPWADTPSGQTPPLARHPLARHPRRPLQQIECILLECILVQYAIIHGAWRTYNSALSKTSYNGGLWENNNSAHG